jgi:hypothetical protein
LVVYVHGVLCFVYCCGRSMADFSDCVNLFFYYPRFFKRMKTSLLSSMIWLNCWKQ